jgi:hypothetical protein
MEGQPLLQSRSLHPPARLHLRGQQGTTLFLILGPMWRSRMSRGRQQGPELQLPLAPRER